MGSERRTQRREVDLSANTSEGIFTYIPPYLPTSTNTACVYDRKALGCKAQIKGEVVRIKLVTPLAMLFRTLI